LKEYLSGPVRKDQGPSVIIERAMVFYIPMLKENYDNPDQRIADIRALCGLASGYRDLNRFLADLILDPPLFTGDLAGKPILDEDYLILSTVHSAKGLEWNCVYIIDAADGWFPSDMSAGSKKEIEEELRLLYVAMTRAKDYLTVLYPKKHYTKPNTHSDNHIYGQLSRFLNEEVTRTMRESFQGKTGETGTEDSGLKKSDGIRNKIRKMF
jgi:DNA helicase-2/ATP-dependent DNA helicase PcrA